MYTEEEYNGNPIVVLKKEEEDKYPFKFGLRKAQLVLEHIDEINDFVDRHQSEEVHESWSMDKKMSMSCKVRDPRFIRLRND